MDLYLPGVHGSQRPSSRVEPVSVGWYLAEALENPSVGGHVEVTMSWHVVGVLWYWPEGHWKTQQTPPCSTLLEAHGGEVELVVEVVLRPSEVLEKKSISNAIIEALFIPIVATIGKLLAAKFVGTLIFTI